MDLEQIIQKTFVARAEHHALVDSTNSLARRYAMGNAEPAACSYAMCQDSRRGPFLIIADGQTAGRGRGSNRWWTGRGSLAFSLLMPADMVATELAQRPLVGLATAVAVAETVAPLVTGHNVSVHWPNDVYADGRKLAGTLIEALSDGRHIVGIGINCNNTSDAAPAELRRKAAVLCELAERQFDRQTVLIDVLQRLEQTLQTLAESPEDIAHEVDRLCGQRGSRLVLKIGTQTIEGRCLGISASGGLVLETPQGPQTFHSGSLN